MSRSAPVSKGAMLLAVLTTFFLSGLAVAMAPAPVVVFEDRNDNGVFDGSDVDITQKLLDEAWLESSESVVVSGGTLKARDPHWAQTRDSGGIYIHSAKKITVLGSLLAEYHTSQVTLWAGDTIRIGSNVTLSAKDFVAVVATNGLAIGDNVTVKSQAGSDNMTIIDVSSDAGDVTIGSGFVASARKEIRINAFDGRLGFGPGSQITSNKEFVSLLAGTTLTMDNAQIKAVGDADFFAPDAIRMRNGKVSLNGKGGALRISAYNGTADLSGTKFKPEPEVNALNVVR